MTEQNERHRIHTVITRSAILHVEDALEIGKLRLFALAYKRGQGAQAHAVHFLDVADARPLLTDLAGGRLAEEYTEFKGSPNGGEPVSRVLKVKDKPDARSPIIIELANGPGEVIGQGAIKPKGKPTAQVAIFLSRWEARKLALAVLEHLQAYAMLQVIGLADQVTPAQEQEAEDVGERAGAAVEPVTTKTAQNRPPAPAEPAAPADATTFWRAAYAAGIAQEAAKGYVTQAAGDWGRALAMLPAV